ncbi:phosphatidylinositol-3-/phosphoinositide 5-phosphatase INP53 [Sugiyamaella lignohabitans]|uniref:phosphoinositide 5-phosphatase n=1 Tax=Sugiyamaella lignohabitans TaxID=796027 RepID=A0A167FQT5_9ASCO|nr:phosphatidylinositol-3-/phosphoinositide 5-phosphatase INP53 [Sugiyamaella lignohabitans]ANB15579.1 phosphatidylinositol-3-/phosphoinositide 5-phosphatase INP53 [Sugiyamaella lignohabitans]
MKQRSNKNSGQTPKAGAKMQTIDESFMWNSYMIDELTKFRNRLPQDQMEALDKQGFLTTVIRGFAGTRKLRMGDRQARLTVISRQSCRRAGTRYNARGIDDDGNVANFVETETILDIGGNHIFGYTQLRGSVPIFWEQDNNLLSAKVNITRSFEATQPAFRRHFEALMSRFGSVHIINLLSEKSGEIDLTERYERHVQSNPSLATNLGYMAFDFHKEVASGGYANATRILPRLQDTMIDFGFYSYNSATGEEDSTEQIGIFRTNCLDCLDRTNMIQQLVSRDALELFLEYHDINAVNYAHELWTHHNVLWADNGDQLSQIYAGTNALKTSFTRSGRSGLSGALADVTKSVGRLYVNNFVDKSRQNTMDVLLGRIEGQVQVILHDPIYDYVNAEVSRRKNEYSSSRDIKIFAGTFNINGKMADEDLSSWLFPESETRTKDDLPDLYLIGFQELVELTPGQILNADAGKKEFWANRVSRCLNTRDRYVLLRSGQLVGTALMVFVKETEIFFVKNVEGATKKTGLGGMAGNKGGVAVSFLFANTSFCFITAHLAAGANNIDERHQDYKTLSTGLQFSRGRKIKDHDTVIWLGDFNYRVNLPNERVRGLIERGHIRAIFEYDQLNNQMIKGETFPYYNEMEINFMPTYKFDNGTDIYDSSEKARVPSWTDRILSRGTNIRQLSYNSAPVMFSDHRPVYATFTAQVIIIDDDAKQKLSNQIYQKRRDEVGDTNILVNILDLNENMLTHGLPPPSTDSKKWWIAGGQHAKVDLAVPSKNHVINPYKPANPFDQQNSSIPDFIERPPALPKRPTPSDAGAVKRKPVIPQKPDHLSGSPLKATQTATSSIGSASTSTSSLASTAPSISPTTNSDNSTNAVNQTARSLAPAVTQPPLLPPRPGSISSESSLPVPRPSSASVSSDRSIPLRPSSTTSDRLAAPAPPPPRSRTASLASTKSNASSQQSLMDGSMPPAEVSTWTPLQPTN